LPLDPKFTGSYPPKDDEFLMAINTVALLFRRGSKDVGYMSRSCGMLKNPTGKERDTS
jgi:hypothetical protein